MPIYSARNPIPNVKQFADNVQKRVNLQKGSGEGGAEYDKDQAASNRRTVVDPVTKSNVVIQDIKGDFKKSVRRPEATIPLANIEPQTDPLRPNEVPGADMPVNATGFGDRYRQILDDLAPPEANATVTREFPQHDTKRNVLYYRKPHSDLQNFFTAVEDATLKLTIGILCGTILLNFMFVGGRWKGLFASIVSGLTISIALHLWLRRIQHEANDRNWDTEKARAEAAKTALVPESVEWLNNLIGTVWQLINPEMFQAVADTLEDVMQASVPPSIIENVKVADINQGTNPLKILSLRSLPDASTATSLGGEQTKDEVDRKKKEREIEDDPNSRYYNLEASFAYHALPATGVASKAQNIHLEIAFYLGVRGLFGVPLPIFAELQGIVGTVRLRFQTTPTPPFVKNMTMTFMGLPKLSVSVVPMTQKGLNVLDLPLISKFVDNAIGAAIDEYVAPKSLSLDISKLIEGDAIKKETDALGVFYIKIRDAKDLPAMDRGGGSDTYITIAFSKLSTKPMYCTRVITKDLNPSWEEDTCILIHREQLTGGEKLSVQLWDSDRMGKDDKVGAIEFDFHDLIEKEGTMQKRSDTLTSEKDGKEVQGHLNWEIGFFRRTKFKEAMRTSGEDVRIPKELRGRDEFKDPQGVTNTAEEALAVNVPPDPTYPTGVVSIIIQEIKNLELQRVRGTFGKSRQYSPAQDFGENKDEEGSNLPSSYCTVMVNDTLAFKTRTKVNSSRPMFSAEVERFVRDWRNTVITIGVRDSRHREHDPLIGACSLKLSDILQTSSQVTRSYALDGGVGYGMINVSVLFRSVQLTLDKNLLGWDVGSVEIMNDTISLDAWSGHDDIASSRIVMKTDVGSVKVRRKWATTEPLGWDLARNTLRIPVRQRYGSALRLEFYARGRRKPIAYAIQWLTDINDNENTTVTLPIWKTKNADSILQNYVDGYDVSLRENVDATQAGEVTFKFRFKDGLDESHRRYIESNDDRETMDAFEACLAEGSRRRIVKRETGATIKKLVQIGATEEVPDKAEENKTNEPAGNRTSISTTDTDSDYEDEQQRPGVHRFKSGAQLETENSKSILEATEQENQVADQWKKAVVDVVDDDDYESDEETRLQAGDDPNDVHELQDMQALDESGSDDDDNDNDGADPDAKRIAKERKMSERRQMYRRQRGMMQWKPARNLAFFKDELKVGARRIKNKFGLTGRAPDVETEISQAQ